VDTVLIVTTLLGGIAAVWFFWDKIRAFFENDSLKNQHATITTEESILRLIGESISADWTSNTRRQTSAWRYVLPRRA